MGKEIDNLVQEVLSVPGRINPRRSTMRQIVIKLKTRENKGKTKSNTQGDSHKDNMWYFYRNSSGQKGIAGYT